jgi:hypothetical protein
MRDRRRASVDARTCVKESNEKFSLRLCVLYARVATRGDAASMGATFRMMGARWGARPPRLGFWISFGLPLAFPVRACVGERCEA